MSKPLYLSRVETLMSQLGDKLTPQRLIKRLEAAKLPAGLKEGMIRQLQLLSPLIRAGARLNDCLLSGAPVFVLQESRYLSADVAVPLKACVINALGLPLRDSTDPLRWVLDDEIKKVAHNAVMIECSRESVQERWHRRVSLMANGQRGSGMDEAFFSQATVVAAFRLSLQKEVRVLKDRFSPFRDVPDREFSELRHGECLVGAVESTGDSDLYRCYVRPTLMSVGGTTLRSDE